MNSSFIPVSVLNPSFLTATRVLSLRKFYRAAVYDDTADFMDVRQLLNMGAKR